MRKVFHGVVIWIIALSIIYILTGWLADSYSYNRWDNETKGFISVIGILLALLIYALLNHDE